MREAAASIDGARVGRPYVAPAVLRAPAYTQRHAPAAARAVVRDRAVQATASNRHGDCRGGVGACRLWRWRRGGGEGGGGGGGGGWGGGVGGGAIVGDMGGVGVAGDAGAGVSVGAGAEGG